MNSAVNTYKQAHSNRTLSLYRSSDPTRTLTLRSRYAGEMRKRFRHIRGMIRDAIINKDVFGIAGGHEGLQANVLVTYQADVPPNAFDFPRVSQKIDAFMEWLEQQVEDEMLTLGRRSELGSTIEKSWQDIYIEDSYKRGVQRATYEMDRLAYPVQSIQAQGGMQMVMSMPAHIDRLGVLYTRAFNELKGITGAMDQQISRILAQGLADGDGPRLLARKLNATISGSGMGELGITDSLGRFIPAQRRAEILARTEVIRAHHQGMIQTYKNWGMEGVEVQAEFRTAGYNVCSVCEGYQGKIFTLKQAENLIPVHPQCRCIALPAREGDVTSTGQRVGEGITEKEGEQPLDIESAVASGRIQSRDEATRLGDREHRASVRKLTDPVQGKIRIGDMDTHIPLEFLDEFKVEATKQVIQEGARMNQLVARIDESTGRLVVRDGHHRYKAYKELYGDDFKPWVIMPREDFNKIFGN